MQNFIKKTLRITLWTMAVVFLLLNALAFFHAWSFTHYDPDISSRMNVKELTTGQKIGYLLTGIPLPRAVNAEQPKFAFKECALEDEDGGKISMWLEEGSQDKPLVLVLHGYGSSKSRMLSRAEKLRELGFRVALADFPGAGDSYGNDTSIGYHEASTVKACFEYLEKTEGVKPVLFGTSMGAAAILRAVSEYALDAPALMLECPFGTMYDAVWGRIRKMGVPEYPVAPLLMFWGGLQQGFWAFSHAPEEYAKQAKMPCLLMYGEKDERVTMQETKNIYEGLAGTKKLKTFALSGHESFLNHHESEWIEEIRNFKQSHRLGESN